jgi:hypothetical protein
MKYRKLRIAYSAICTTICLLLMVLWVRSYWWITNIQMPPVASRTLQCALYPGRMFVRSYPLRTQSDRAHWITDFSNIHRSQPRYIQKLDASTFPRLGLKFNDWRPGSTYVCFPYWFAIVVVGAISVVPWLRWRFSLRTLLVGMTVVAAILGAVFYAAN